MNSRGGRGFEFDHVPGLLRDEFPELSPALEALEEFHLGETNEPYFVWAVVESVFWPYLERALAKPGAGDPVQLMALSNDSLRTPIQM
jgi:hypothetical protein